MNNSNIIENIDKILQKGETLKRLGHSESLRGLEKIEQADKLISQMHYLRDVFLSDHNPEIWNDPIISGSFPAVQEQLCYVYEDINLLVSDFTKLDTENAKFHNDLTDKMSSTDFSSGSAVYIGANIENRIQVISPSYTPKFDSQDPSIVDSREEILNKLISLLKPFGEKYITMVMGSENALLSEDPDTFTQGAHSMRDCFNLLINDLAPLDVIKAQPWFIPAPDSRSGVTRLDRFKYILYRSGENVDQSQIIRLDAIAKAAKDSLNLCIKRAHYHDPSLTQKETQFAIDQARRTLVKILKLYNDIRGK